MVFLFFYFEEFKPGIVCRLKNGIDKGKMVVVQQIQDDMLWCYDNRPVKYRTNRKGQKVIDFDPACVTAPYSPSSLEITNEIPLQDGGWGASYRKARMF